MAALAWNGLNGITPTARGLLLTNSQRTSGPPIAEHAIAMTMALARGLPTYGRAQQAGEWQRGAFGHARELGGRTLLVVGLGGIGTEVARRADGLGMRVIATRNSGRLGPDFVAKVGLPDELLALAAEADVVVIGAPLYNFSIPTQLKAWIDRLAQPGRTFQYTANGPEGLAKGKTVIVASTRGGVYSTSEGGQAMEHQESYLKVVFGFFGITDVRFVRAEGVAMGPDAKAAALASAEVEITNHTGAAANQASVAQAA